MLVGISRNGKVRDMRVHRLVALSWIPIPEELEGIPVEKLDVCHMDDDRKNNNINNLKWQTRA